MVMPINKNLSHLIKKYSDSAIYSHFAKAINNNQFTTEYQNDPIKTQRVITNIVQRHIDFRDALMDPLNNVKVIEEHSRYFWDFQNKENAQLRGLQTHLSHQMYSDFGFAGNSIAKTGLSGLSLGSFFDPKNHIISVQKDILNGSPHSFRQGIEVAGAKMLSSAMSARHFHVTNDDPSSFLSYDILHNNAPATQSCCDYNSTFTVFDTTKKVFVVHTIKHDAKSQSLETAVSPRNFYIPRAAFVGTVDIDDEKDKVKYLARQAMLKNISVHHYDSKKNHEVSSILQKISQDGKIEDAHELIGFPLLVSNRHNET